ncbi:MAG: hypothetical protein V1907_01820 [Candidatus Kerfeldbacteria bacterium]
MRDTAINFIRRNKRPLMGTFVGVAIAVVVLTAPHIAFATWQDNMMGFLSWIVYGLIQLLASLLVVVINIMVSVAQYSKFIGVPAVEKGWAIVRDVCNMFFIVVLLIIAFGTILRIENYRYNRLLARLIVMAVLVNFSKFIAAFFIDFAQVIMLTFVNAWRDIAAGNITSALGLEQIVSLSNAQHNLQDISVSSGTIFTALLLGLFLVTIAVIVMVVIAIVLILRILALWFLIVLSPLAFLLKTYPSTEKYASRWWQEFGKYVVSGPVVAFLLWLTLAIITSPTNLSSDVFKANPSSGKETTEIITGDVGDESTPESRIAVSISAIGKSENLLNYLIGIMLLVGTLVITKELGVAGGQLAGQMATRIQGFATKAATLAGAGIATGGLAAPAAMMGGKRTVQLAKTAVTTPLKGMRGGLRNFIESRTGLAIHPQEWMEKIREVGKEHRQEALDRRNGIASRRLQGGIKEVAVKKWQFVKGKGLRRVATGEMETRQIQAHPRIGALGMPATAWRHKWQLMAPGAGARFNDLSLLAYNERKELEASEKRLALRKQGRDIRKYGAQSIAERMIQARIDRRTAEIAARRAANPQGMENREVEVDKRGRMTPKAGGKTFDEVIAAEEKARGMKYTPEELSERNKKWNQERAELNIKRAQQRLERTKRESEIRDILSNAATRTSSPYYYQIKKKGDKEKGEKEKEEKVTYQDELDEKLKKAKPKDRELTPDEIAKIEEEHRSEWAEEQAEKSLLQEGAYHRPMETMLANEQKGIEDTTSPERLEEVGQQEIEQKLKEIADDLEKARKGLLTSSQIKQKEEERGKLAGEILGLKGAINDHETGTVKLDEATLKEMERRLKEKGGQDGVLEAQLKKGEGDDKDKEAAKEQIKTLGQTQDTLNAIRNGPASEVELRTLEEAVKAQRTKVQDADKAVAMVRPPVPFEAQRELRDSIKEKEKHLLTDSWHEHAAVFEDALRKGDAALAAAALSRAADYGNENELMNFFGYDYTPQDFKKFIEDMFVKKLHLSDSQALSIATDVGYTAEKTKHWNIARTTAVDSGTGRLQWQKYDDQQKEVLAEVRKVDFENFVRQGNRLAWGNEYIGGSEMRGASREEKERYFRSGGGREFQMADFSQAYLGENFGKMIRGMGQGRFNVNLAVKLTSAMNKDIIDKMQGILTGITQYSEGNPYSFADWRTKIGQFAATDVDKTEFELLERLLRHG